MVSVDEDGKCIQQVNIHALMKEALILPAQISTVEEGPY